MPIKDLKRDSEIEKKKNENGRIRNAFASRERYLLEQWKEKI